MARPDPVRKAVRSPTRVIQCPTRGPVTTPTSPEIPAMADAQACVYPSESAASTITEDRAPYPEAQISDGM